MAKGKPGKKFKYKGQPGNHDDVEKIIWKRSMKHNAAMANAALAYIPVPIPVPVPASLPGHGPSHFPAALPGPVSSYFPVNVPTALPIPLPSHVPLGNSSPINDEAAAAEGVAGFIFMCSVATKPECYRYRVFGLPKGRMEAVEKIKTGAKLFLFDFDLKLLYGIYEALGKGGESLEPAAFGGSFPAQVRFSIAKDCMPVPECLFKHVIQENYRGRKFEPELNSEQVKKLLLLFQEIPLRQTPIMPALAASQPPAAAHVSHDPYRAVAAYAAPVPPGVAPHWTYGTAGHPRHAQPIAEARSTPLVTESYHPPDPHRASEPYHPPNPRGAYLPQNPQEQELISRYLGGRGSRASPPQVHYHKSEQKLAPQSADPKHAYYSALPAAAKMKQPTVARLGPGYHYPNHMYAGATSTATSASSSMYLPAPAYR